MYSEESNYAIVAYEEFNLSFAHITTRYFIITPVYINCGKHLHWRQWIFRVHANSIIYFFLFALQLSKVGSKFKNYCMWVFDLYLNSSSYGVAGVQMYCGELSDAIKLESYLQRFSSVRVVQPGHPSVSCNSEFITLITHRLCSIQKWKK